MTRWIALGIALCALGASANAYAAPPTLPPAARAVDVDEHLGGAVDPNLAFVDDAGNKVTLGRYLDGKRPVVLTLAYFRCPMLCGAVLRGEVEAAKKIAYTPGRDYLLVTASIDPRDLPDEAARKQATALAALGRQDARDAWPFLVSAHDASDALARQIGFQYAYDPASDQYAHPAMVVVLTPRGRISRYFYGTEYTPLDLEVALSEAAGNKIGTIADRVVMTCYRWDPGSRRYGFSILAFLRLGALAIACSVFGLLAVLWRAERRRSTREPRP